MIVAPHSLVDLDHILASRKPSNMEHRTESLLEVFTDTKALSNRSRHTAQSYTSGESDETEFPSYYIPGITHRAKCLSSCDDALSPRCKPRRRITNLKQRMMSATPLTNIPRRESENQLLENFPRASRRRHLVVDTSASSMSKPDYLMADDHSPESTRTFNSDSGISLTSKYLDLKRETDELVQRQNEILRKQKRTLRTHRKMNTIWLSKNIDLYWLSTKNPTCF